VRTSESTSAVVLEPLIPILCSSAPEVRPGCRPTIKALNLSPSTFANTIKMSAKPPPRAMRHPAVDCANADRARYAPRRPLRIRTWRSTDSNEGTAADPAVLPTSAALRGLAAPTASTTVSCCSLCSMPVAGGRFGIHGWGGDQEDG